ncbi:MAG: hypothetical protein PQJ46_03480 [Spirochaetales bacterium]|nr:hypothetical protein [Spirochaetales bacterium]
MRFIERMLSLSESPWKKEKRIYDSEIKMELITDTDKSYILIRFFDFSSSEINYAFTNKYGEISFWYNDKDNWFYNYLHEYVK